MGRLQRLGEAARRFAALEGDDLQILVEEPGHSDLGHTHAVLHGKLLGTGEALKVLLRPIALLGGFGEEGRSAVPVIALEFAGDKAAGESGICSIFSRDCYLFYSQYSI